MNIRIVCAGKMKETFFTDASREYEKRLSRYVTLTVCEVADEKTPDSMSRAEEIAAMDKEGARMMKHIRDTDYVIALCVGGKRRTSEEFAARLEELMNRGRSSIVFAIGGSLGLAECVLDRADETLSVSDMTLPHRLCRIFLLEQIYRAYKINAHETYHK